MAASARESVRRVFMGSLLSGISGASLRRPVKGKRAREGCLALEVHVDGDEGVRIAVHLAEEGVVHSGDDLLRQQLGFDGLCFTDALDMQGAKAVPGSTVVNALLAGNDVLLMPTSVEKAIEEVETDEQMAAVQETVDALKEERTKLEADESGLNDQIRQLEKELEETEKEVEVEPDPAPQPDPEGITPAHAGKRFASLLRRSRCWDHPRACGEKLDRGHWETSCQGSPPRMRGKVFSAH